MNEELTREVLEAMAGCEEYCSLCGANEVCGKCGWQEMMQALATALLEEGAKQNVWDEAPDAATQAQIKWFTKYGGFSGTKVYTRELPKTRTRIMAEEVTALVNRAIDGISIDEIETLLTKYAEELVEKEGE